MRLTVLLPYIYVEFKNEINTTNIKSELEDSGHEHICKSWAGWE